MLALPGGARRVEHRQRVDDLRAHRHPLSDEAHHLARAPAQRARLGQALRALLQARDERVDVALVVLHGHRLRDDERHDLHDARVELAHDDAVELHRRRRAPARSPPRTSPRAAGAARRRRCEHAFITRSHSGFSTPTKTTAPKSCATAQDVGPYRATAMRLGQAHPLGARPRTGHRPRAAGSSRTPRTRVPGRARPRPQSLLAGRRLWRRRRHRRGGGLGRRGHAEERASRRRDASSKSE